MRRWKRSSSLRVTSIGSPAGSRPRTSVGKPVGLGAVCGTVVMVVSRRGTVGRRGECAGLRERWGDPLSARCPAAVRTGPRSLVPAPPGGRHSTSARGRGGPMEVRLLGPLEVSVDGRSGPPPAAAERGLLALLALSAGRVVSSDVLLQALWGEDLPVHPANALQLRVSKLRRRLSELGMGERTVLARPPEYVLDVRPDAVDVHRCTRLLGEARRVTPL